MGVKGNSTAALNTLMQSRRWLALTRRERVLAESGLLEWVENKEMLDTLRSLVLDMPALIGFRNTDGANALHSAAHDAKAVPLVCALIKEGVDPAATNDAGQTPADVARERGHALQATLLGRAADDKRKRDLKQQQQQTTKT